MKLPHRSLRLLAACARTAAVNTVARYVAPATVSGAPWELEPQQVVNPEEARPQVW